MLGGKPEIKLNDLHYYFDSTRRDSIDRGAVGRKSWQFLALKEQVLALPEPQFELAMRTLHNMVKKSKTADSPEKERRTAAIQLFNRAAETQEDRHLSELSI